jgi:WD40 repeat protein
MVLSGFWKRHGRLLGWSVLLLAMTGVGLALYARLPVQPRWVVQGSIAPLGLAPDGKTFRTETRRPEELPNKSRSRRLWMPHGGPVKFWDVETGAEVLNLLGESGPRWRVALSNDGQRLAAIGAPSEESVLQDLRTIDLETGRERRITIDGRFLCDISLSPDGHLLLLFDWWRTFGRDRRETDLLLYDADSLHLITKTPAMGRPPWQWSTDGKGVESTFSPADTKAILITQNSGIANAHTMWQWSTDGKAILIYSTQDGSASLRRISADGEAVVHFKGAGDWLAMTPDGKTLATAPARADDADRAPFQRIILWDADTGNERGIIPVASLDPETAPIQVEVVPDGRTLLVPHGRPADRVVGVWDIETGKWLGDVSVREGLCHYFSDRDGLALGSDASRLGQRRLEWYRFRPFGILWQRDLPGRQIEKVDFMPSHKRVFVLTGDDTRTDMSLELLDLETGEILLDLFLDHRRLGYATKTAGPYFAVNLIDYTTPERSPFWEFIEERILSVLMPSLRRDNGALSAARVFDGRTGEELGRVNLPNADLADLAADGRSLFLYIEAGADGEATLLCYDIPPRRAWSWIIGIPLALGLLLASLRAGWRRLRRRPAPAARSARNRLWAPLPRAPNLAIDHRS